MKVKYSLKPCYLFFNLPVFVGSSASVNAIRSRRTGAKLTTIKKWVPSKERKK